MAQCCATSHPFLGKTGHVELHSRLEPTFFVRSAPGLFSFSSRPAADYNLSQK
jgi:hypothetical protein